MPGRRRSRQLSASADLSVSASVNLSSGVANSEAAHELSRVDDQEVETPTLSALANSLDTDDELGPDDVPPPIIEAINGTVTEDVDPESAPAPEAECEELSEEAPLSGEEDQTQEPADALDDAAEIANAPEPSITVPDAPEPSVETVDLSANLGVGNVDVPTLGAAPENVRRSFTHEMGTTPEQQANQSQRILDGLTDNASDLQVEVGETKEPIADRINAAADLQIARIDSAAQSIEEEIRQAFLDAHAFTLERTNQATQAIESTLQLTLNNIDAAERSALELLDGEFETIEERLDRVILEGDRKLNAAITDAADEIETNGRTRGEQAMQVGSDHASGYRGRNNSDKLERKRDEARAKAAVEASEGYRDSFAERAGQTANELREAASNMSGAVGEASATVGAELGTLKSSGEESIKEQARLAREQAEINAEAAKNAATEAWAAYETTLDEQLHSSLDAHKNSVDTMRGTVRAAAGDAIRDIAEATEVGVMWFDLVIAMVAATVASAEDADESSFADFAAHVIDVLLEGRDEMIEGGEEAAGTFETALAEQVDTGIQNLQSGARSIRQRVQEAMDTFDETQATLTGDFATDCAVFAEGVLEGLEHIATETGKQGDAYIDTFEESIDSQVEEIEQEMTQVKSSSDSQFEQALGELPGAIHDRAEEAARAIQPWLKKALATVVSVVVAVVVFVAVAAFCVLTLGTGLVVAGLIAGGIAAVAAVLASDLVNMATGVQDGLSSWETYATAFICGAVGGAVGGFTAGMAPLATAGITGLSMGLTDSLTNVFIMGEEFSWTRLITTTLVSGVTAGLISKFVSTPNLGSVSKGPRAWNSYRGNPHTTTGAGGVEGVVREMVADRAANEAAGLVGQGAEAGRSALIDTPAPVERPTPDYDGEDLPSFDIQAPTFEASQLHESS